VTDGRADGRTYTEDSKDRAYAYRERPGQVVNTHVPNASEITTGWCYRNMVNEKKIKYNKI